MTERKEPMLTIADIKGNDTQDAGWNDPPMFSYSDHIKHTSATKRNILNKRVAFPMNTSSISETPSKGVDPTCPPTLNCNILPPPKSSKFISETAETTDTCKGNIKQENKEEILESVMSVLYEIIEEKEDIKTDSTKKELITKTISLMETVWKEDKLTPDIYGKMMKLSEALKMGDKDEANHIYTGLMVDYPRLCGAWICGVRQLF